MTTSYNLCNLMEQAKQLIANYLLLNHKGITSDHQMKQHFWQFYHQQLINVYWSEAYPLLIICPLFTPVCVWYASFSKCTMSSGHNSHMITHDNSASSTKHGYQH